MDLQLLNSELTKVEDLFQPGRKLYEISKTLPEEIQTLQDIDTVLEMSNTIQSINHLSPQRVLLQVAESRIFLSRTYIDPNSVDDYI